MQNDLIFEGKKFISSRRAAQFCGYTQDYIGQLIRGRKVDARMVGRSWFVSEESLISYKVQVDEIQGKKTISEELVGQEVPTVSVAQNNLPQKTEGGVQESVSASVQEKVSLPEVSGGNPDIDTYTKNSLVRKIAELPLSENSESQFSAPSVLGKKILTGALSLSIIALVVVMNEPKYDRVANDRSLDSSLAAVVTAPIPATYGVFESVALGTYETLSPIFGKIGGALAYLFSDDEPEITIVKQQTIPVTGKVPSTTGTSSETRILGAIKDLRSEMSTSFSKVFEGLSAISGQTYVISTSSVLSSGVYLSNGISASEVSSQIASVFGVLQAQINRLTSSNNVNRENTRSVFESIDIGNLKKTNIDEAVITDSTITGSTFSGTSVTTDTLMTTGSGSISILGSSYFDTDTLVIDSVNRRIGIGTSSPYEKLSVSGSIVADAVFGTSTSATSTFAGGFTLGTSGFVYEQATKNIGIGTTSPNATLSILQSANGTPIIDAYRITDTAPTGDFINYRSRAGTTLFRVDNSGNLLAGGIINTGSQTVTSISGPQFRVQYDGSNEITTSVSSTGTTTLAVSGTTPSLVFTPQTNRVTSFQFTNASEIPVLSIDTQNQRVGIGTSSPTQKLSVAGSTLISGGQLTTENNGYTTNTIEGAGGQGALQFYRSGGSIGAKTQLTGAASVGSMDAWGRDEIGGLQRIAAITIGTDDTVTTTNSAGYIRFQTTPSGTVNPIDRMRITSGGNVGVGSTTPWAQLSVNPNGVSGPSFVIGSSTKTDFMVTNGGNVIIGTSTSSFGSNGGRLVIDDTKDGQSVVRLLNLSDSANSYAEFNVRAGSVNSYLGASPLNYSVTSGAASAGRGYVWQSGTGSLGLDIVAAAVNTDIRLYTGGASASNERMRISSTGNVGIGTTSPLAKLSIATFNGGSAPLFIIASSTSSGATTTNFIVDAYGNAGINVTSNTLNPLDFGGGVFTVSGRNANTNGNIQITGNNIVNSTGVIGRVAFTDNTAETYTNVAFIQVNKGGTSDSGEFLFQTKPAGGALAERLRITSAGNVGIGTTTPVAKFSVNGIVGDTNTTLFSVSSSTSSGASTTFAVSNNNRVAIGTSTPARPLQIWTTEGDSIQVNRQGTFNIGDTIGLLAFQTGSGGPNDGNSQIRAYVKNSSLGYSDLRLRTKGVSGSLQDVLTADYTGNVGIGTTTPWAQLSVNPNGISGPSFAVGSSTRTDFIVMNGGNVGIGTANPQVKLDIKNGHVSIGNTGDYDSTVEIRPAAGISPLDIRGDSNQETLYVTYNGRIGLGTTNPLSRLDVVGEASIGTYAGTIAAPTNGLIVSGTVGIGTTSPYAKLSVVGPVVAEYFNATSTSATSTLSGGLVVGDAARAGNIRLYGKNGVTNGDTASQLTFYNGDTDQLGPLNYIKVTPNHSNGSQPKMVFGVPSTFSVNAADIEALTLYMGGNIDMYGLSGGRVKIYDQGTDTGNISKLLIATGNDTAGSVSGISFTANNGGHVKTSIYARTRASSDYGRADLVFALNNVGGSGNVTTADEKMRLTYEGNLGIGTTSPFTKLSVAGDAYIGGNLTATGTATVISGGDYVQLDPVSSGNPTIRFMNPGVADFKIVNDGALEFIDGDTSNVAVSFSKSGAIAADTDLTLGAGRTSGDDSGIRFTGAGVRNGNFVYRVDENQFELHTDNNANGITDNYGAPNFVVPGKIGIGTTTPWGKFSIASANTTTGAPLFVIASSSASVATTTPFIVTAIGNVGIGTTSPSANLAVVGTLGGNILNLTNSAGAIGLIIDNDTLSTQIYGTLKSRVGASLNLQAGNTPAVTITTGGAVGIGTTSPVAALSVDSGSNNNYGTLALKTNNSNNAGVTFFTSGGSTMRNWQIASNYQSAGGLSFMRSSTNVSFPTIAVVEIDTNGNLGIGTTSPFSKLSVAGDTYIGGNLTATGTVNFTGASFSGGTTTVTNLIVTNTSTSTFAGAINVGAGSSMGLISARAPNPNPSLGIDSFAVVTSGLYGGGIGLKDGAGDFGIWLDTAGTAARFGFGTNLASVNPYVSMTSSGFLGIGENTPGVLLDVRRATNLTYSPTTMATESARLRTINNTGAPQYSALNLSASGNNGVAIASSSLVMMQRTFNGTTADLAFQLGQSDGTAVERLRITSEGNVGIGTTSPSSPLSVQTTSAGNIALISSVQSGTVGGNLGVSVDVVGRTALVVNGGYGSTGSGGVNGGAYFTANGYEESWFNVQTRSNTAGQRNMRFGNLSNKFSVQLLNDAANAIMSTPFSIENTAPTNSFYIASSGNVGIGTTTPNAKLNIYGAGGSGGASLFNIQASSGDAGLYLTNTTSHAQIFLNGSILKIGKAGVGDFLNINTSSGNVGIGTTTPDQKLVVNGAARIMGAEGSYSGGEGLELKYQGAISYLTSYNRTGSTWLPLVMQGSYTTLQSNGSEVLRATGGNVGIGTTSPQALGGHSGVLNLYGSNATAIVLTDAVGEKHIRVNDGDLKFTDRSGNEQLVIANAGNVGIGTTTPANLLEIYKSQNTDTAISVQNPNTGTAARAIVSAQAGNTAALLYAQGSGFTSSAMWQANGATLYSSSGASAGLTIATGASAPIRFVPVGVERMRITPTGEVGIGTTSPYAKLSVVGPVVAEYFHATSTTATSTIAGGLDVGSGALRYDFSSGVTNIDNLEIGNTFFESDAGIITWADLPVTSASANGVVNSYSASINGSPLLTVYSTSDGAGSAINQSVGIGSSTPWGKLAVNPVAGDANQFVVGSSTRTSFIITPAGNVGIGTTSPDALFTTNSSSATTLAHFYNNYGSIFLAGQATGVNEIVSRNTANTAYADFGIRSQAGTQFYVSTNGNVGIGTTTPGAKLNVFGATTNFEALRLSNGVNGPNSSTSLAFYDATVNASYQAASIASVRLGAAADWGLAFTTGQYAGGSQPGLVERMRITSTGNVGIGTTNPGTLLDVSSGVQGGGINIGADTNLYTRTNAVVKVGSITTPHYLTAEEPLGVINGYITSISSNVMVGGGLAGQNAATAVQFFTASSYNTLTGTSRMIIDSTGNVGIGTTSPTGTLTINPSSGNASVDILRTSGGGQAYIGMKTSSVPTSASNLYWSFGLQQNSNNFNIQSYDGATLSSRLTIDNNGNIGIGTTTPGTKLQVGSTPYSTVVSAYQLAIAGDGIDGIQILSPSTNSGRLMFGDESNGEIGGLIYDHTNDSLAFSANAGERFRITSSGNVGIGTTSPMARLQVDRNGSQGDVIVLGDGTYRMGAMGIESSTNTFYIGNPYNTSNIQFRTSGTTTASTRMTIGSTGNIGIGTTSPNNKLHISDSAATDVRFQITNLTTGFGASDGLHLAVDSVGDAYVIQREAANLKLYTNNTPTSGITINSSGNVGVGTTTPVSTLSVQGSLCVRDTGSCGTTAGTIYATTVAITDIDLAENYQTTDATLMAGEIVSIDSSNPTYIQRASQSGTAPLLGVVSTAPGVLLGKEMVDSKPVALSGRVPVKVNLLGGDIAVGDRIALSAVDGEGRRVIGSEETIGIALESFTSTSTTDRIEVFVNLRYQINTSQLTIDTNGNIGIGTTTPTYKLHVIGDIAAQSFVNISTKTSKKDIEYLDEEAKTSILEKIRTVGVATYKYNNEDETDTAHLGLIAEEAPVDVLATGGKGVDIYKLSTFILAGVQEQQNQIEALQTRFASLDTTVANLASTTASIASTTGALASTTLELTARLDATASLVAMLLAQASTTAGVVPVTTTTQTVVWSSDMGTQMLSFLQNAGLRLENGIAYVSTLVTDVVTTKKLTVGDSANLAAAGVTILDRATGQPSCVYIENSIVRSEGGACGALPVASSDGSQTTPVIVTDPVPVIEDTATSTTDTIIDTGTTASSTDSGVPVSEPTSTDTTTVPISTDTTDTTTTEPTPEPVAEPAPTVETTPEATVSTVTEPVTTP